MATEPGDSKDDGVLAEFGDEHRDVLLVSPNSKVYFGDVGDGTRGGGSAINDMEGAGCVESVEGEVVTAGEIFINKCISSCSCVD